MKKTEFISTHEEQFHDLSAKANDIQAWINNTISKWEAAKRLDNAETFKQAVLDDDEFDFDGTKAIYDKLLVLQYQAAELSELACLLRASLAESFKSFEA